MGFISEAIFELEQERLEEAKTQAFNEGFTEGFQEAKKRILRILQHNENELWREINELGENEDG